MCSRLMDVTDETEVLVRSAIFGREVLRAYESICEGSGLKLLSHHRGGAAGCLPHRALVGEPRRHNGEWVVAMPKFAPGL